MNKIFTFFFTLMLLNLGAQNAPERINKVISQSNIKAHLSFLASDELEGRETGKRGIELAAKYISTHFMSLDLDTVLGFNGYRQEVPFVTFTPPDSAYIRVNDIDLTYREDFIVLNGKQTNLTAEPIFIHYGNEADLEEKDLRLKLAISFCGDGQSTNVREWFDISRKKYERVKKAGAVGLIEIYQNAMTPWNFMKRFGSASQTGLDMGKQSEGKLPHVWVGNNNADVLTGLTSGTKSIKLYNSDIKNEKFNSANIVAILSGTDPELKNEYIVYSAHYDHVGIGRADATGDTIYNGARDNASGTTAILSLAKYFSQHPPLRSSIFVLFTAEEKGLLGSSWFVENSPVPLDQIKYCFNIDNGGYNDTTIVSVIGLTRTTVEHLIEAASASFGLEAIEDAAGEQGLFDRSDNVNFARKGIPAPTFSLGFRAFDEEIFKYYHQPGDDVHSLNFNYIEKYVKSFILSSEKIANTRENIFWKPGDKYYQIGRDLYKLQD